MASLLALRGLEADYSPQADMSLQRASRLDFGRSWLPSTGPVDALDVSPDGAHVITIARDGVARLWSVATGDLEREYQVGVTFSWPILFSPDGTRFLINAEEGVSIWDVATGARIFTAKAGTEADFSSDGSQVFIGRGDRIDVVDIASGGIARTMRVPSESLQLFPDGDRLLTSAGGDAYISDARTGAIVHQMSGFGSTKHVSVSRDGRYVATGDQDKTAKVWDAGTGRLVQTLVGHSEILFGMAFSPDGTKLLTGSLDNTARLWDIASGKEIRRFTGHTAAVYAVGFTPDGRYAITSSADKSARIWDLSESARGRHAGRSDLLRLRRGLFARWQQDLHGQRRWHGAPVGRDVASGRLAALYGQSRGRRRLLARRSVSPARARAGRRPNCGTWRPPAWSGSCSVRPEGAAPVSRPTGA